MHSTINQILSVNTLLKTWYEPLINELFRGNKYHDINSAEYWQENDKYKWSRHAKIKTYDDEWTLNDNQFKPTITSSGWIICLSTSDTYSKL